jgi:hypothetical protein
VQELPQLGSSGTFEPLSCNFLWTPATGDK